MNIKYDIVSTSLGNFTYKTPLVEIISDNNAQIRYSKHEPSHSHIKNITLLSLVGREIKNGVIGKIISYEPMHYVNDFLMSIHIENDRQESGIHSRGLINFFSFLIKMQEKWDSEFDEDSYEDGIDIPRPTWDKLPIRQSNKITYQYRNALFKAATGKSKETFLARTTANAYMNTVIKFYTFHLHKKQHDFGNPPFIFEEIAVFYNAKETSMENHRKKIIHTTDLRLNIPKSSRNEGGSVGELRRDLRPLSNGQWKEVEHILLHTRKVIKSVKGKLKMMQIAEEYCLLFLICRYTGMRREEAASLHLGQIVQPVKKSNSTQFESPMLQIGIGDQYGSLTKTVSGYGNKSRVTIIPSAIMQLLYEYTCSTRYHNRLKAFNDLCQRKLREGDVSFFESEDGIDKNKNYLFLNNKGTPFFLNLNELNWRWIEIRNTVTKKTNKQLHLSIHNLRSTFATNLFRTLLRRMSVDKALALVSQMLGHEDLKTTLIYLKLAQDEPTGDEIYEDVLSWIGVFEGFEGFEHGK